ncbi:MAG: hypothetical protein Q9P44_16565 [Anaerolineae bacterium]|nr:hypothetical protein [Anaerolineae bacterium]
MGAIQALKTEQIEASFDETRGLLLVKYRGKLLSVVTNQFYAWLMANMKANPEKVTEARGSIYDFRDVTDFEIDNLSAPQQGSKQLTSQSDVTGHPVALIVNDIYQEGMVKLSMQLTEQQDRKRIVKSTDEAVAFIDNWYKEHST